MRFVVPVLLMLTCPILLTAQPTTPPLVPVTKLTVKAALPPVPAMRHELLPSFRDKSPGNAALTYHRAMLLLDEQRPQQEVKDRFEQESKIDEMVAKPLKEIKSEEVKKYLRNYERILREITTGAKRERCDWDLERRIDAEGIGVLLPEVQKMRELARLLSIRCRIHMAEGNIADALADVQTGFAMARHVGAGPTLIQGLVGMAVFQIFAQRLEQIMEMPDCPNLYWSLTALPHPLFDLRLALEGEVRMMDASMPLLREMDKPMTIEQAQKAIDGWAIGVNEMMNGPPNEWIKSRFVLATMVSLRHPAAKENLLKMGRTESEVNAMPAAQAVLLESVLQYKQLRDELFVWFHRPYREAREGLNRAMDEAKRVRAAGPGDFFRNGLLMMLPAAGKMHMASMRTDRKLAMLRTIEALRMHAAKEGKFPARLTDVTIVPLPDDPVTGKLLEYELTKDGTVLLTAPAPEGETASANNALKYELTLTK